MQDTRPMTPEEIVDEFEEWLMKLERDPSLNNYPDMEKWLRLSLRALLLHVKNDATNHIIAVHDKSLDYMKGYEAATYDCKRVLEKISSEI